MVCLFACLSVCMSFCLSVCLHVCLCGLCVLCCSCDITSSSGVKSCPGKTVLLTDVYVRMFGLLTRGESNLTKGHIAVHTNRVKFTPLTHLALLHHRCLFTCGKLCIPLFKLLFLRKCKCKQTIHVYVSGQVLSVGMYIL